MQSRGTRPTERILTISNYLNTNFVCITKIIFQTLKKQQKVVFCFAMNNYLTIARAQWNYAYQRKKQFSAHSLGITIENYFKILFIIQNFQLDRYWFFTKLDHITNDKKTLNCTEIPLSRNPYILNINQHVIFF